MNNNKEKALSPYWSRLMNEAENILRQKIERLERKSVDPEACLLDSDRRLMESYQRSVNGHKSVLKTIADRSFGAKFWAFDTVFREHPSHVLG